MKQGDPRLLFILVEKILRLNQDQPETGKIMPIHSSANSPRLCHLLQAACTQPADPNFTSPVTGHLLPPCLAATPLPASGYGSHPLQQPLPPVPANGHCCHLLSPLLLLPYLCKLSAQPATASSPPSAPGHCDLLQIRGHFQTTGHPQTSGHSPYNQHNLLTSRPVHLNPYSAATAAAGHPTCKHPPEPAPTCTVRTSTHLNRLNFSP
ncbi:hypothetical protein MRB53_021609 [Persea americana]|uniref:Uncharacterized protein n=1 Tax=Persea americana TaxID=3435 RepID=A0ACC2L475_PERAE|nr:hypothetical protein MRB53_021609 [Persea americana]